LFLLAATDNVAYGGWAIAHPGGLFGLLGIIPSPDALLLWRVLGAVLVGQAWCLVAAARRPAHRGLALVALSGRALLGSLWLWLLGTDRVVLPRESLLALLAHEGVWLVVVAGAYGLGRRDRSPATP
jgi:hypothetical protein